MYFFQHWRTSWIFFCLLLVATKCANFSIQETPTPIYNIEAPIEASVETSPTIVLQTPRDLLDIVQEREYLKIAVRVWPDSNLRPPLFRNGFGALDGYEVELAWILADSLGIGLEMTEAHPQQIEAGNWEGEWDIALAWLPITDNAQQTLIFSHPYAYDQGRIVIHSNNEIITTFQDLAGQRIGVPSNTIYYQILSGQAPTVQGQFIYEHIPPDLIVIPYDRDANAFRDLSQEGEVLLDAVIHSSFVVKSALSLENNLPLKQLDAPLVTIPVGLAFDRGGMSSERLRLAIDETLRLLYQDGTLAELSLKWYGQDIATLP